MDIVILDNPSSRWKQESFLVQISVIEPQDKILAINLMDIDLLNMFHIQEQSMDQNCIKSKNEKEVLSC